MGSRGTLYVNKLPPGDTEEKAERFDVNCKIDDGLSIYYLTDLHSSQPSKGVRRYDRRSMSDAIHAIFVELSKLEEIMKKPVNDMTVLDKWSVFFEYAANPTYREAVNQVIASEEVLSVAGELLMNISQNEQERAVFRSRRKFQTDYESDLATAEDNGRIEGRREGRREGEKRKALDIANNLLSLKLPLDQISAATGLTREEIKSLQEKRPLC